MMRTCTLAVTAMGKTTYIYLSQDAASKTIQINDDTSST
jgi:hypothetical protein